MTITPLAVAAITDTLRPSIPILDDFDLVLEAVRQNLGIALLPSDIPTDDVVAIDVDNILSQMRTMNAVYPSRRLLPVQLRTLIDHMSA